MDIFKKTAAAFTAAAVLAVGSAMPAAAATTGDLNSDGVIDVIASKGHLADQ